MNQPALRQSSVVTSLWLVALLTALAILPVFLVEIPAMSDYPNHLARMYLLSAVGTPQENPYYAIVWKLCPNLAMDLIVPAMARFMNVAPATKAFLVFSQVLIVSGAVALEITIKQRHQFAGFAANTVLYSMPFAFGFLNFEFGTGVALWGIALWVLLQNRRLYARFVVHSLFAFSVFVAHLFAFGLYGAVIGVYELYRIREEALNAKETILVVAILVSPAFFVFGFLIASGTPIENGETEWLLFLKLRSIIYALNAYSIELSAFSVSIIFILTYYLFRSRHLIFIAPGKWIAFGLLFLFIALPVRLFGVFFVDVRLVIAAFLIMPAFLAFSTKRQVVRCLPPLVLSAIALLNTGHAATVWLEYRPDYTAIKSSFSLIESGAFVLVASDGSSAAEVPLYHAPVLAVHYANAFVPSLFSAPFTPMRVHAERNNLDLADTYRHYTPVPFSVLAAISEGRMLATSRIACWPSDFDYLYLIGTQFLNPMPDRLTAIAAGKKFTLFRIKKSAGIGSTRCK
jgi:hypothetical protein